MPREISNDEYTLTKSKIQYINVDGSEGEVVEGYVNKELLEEISEKEKSDKKVKKKKSKESRFIVLLTRVYKVDKEVITEVKILREISKSGYYWFSDDLSDALIFGKGDMRYDTVKQNILNTGFYDKDYKVKKISL